MRNRGQAPLFLILVAAALTAATWTLVTSLTSVKSNQDIRYQDERLHLEQVLMGAVDCTQTLNQLGLNTPADFQSKCTSTLGTQSPPYVAMLNADGDPVTDQYHSASGYGDIGHWSFRASCYHDSTQTCLLIHSARPWTSANGNTEGFKKKALLSMDDDWKKLPNSPWGSCCFPPPTCNLTLNPNPLATGSIGTFTLTTTHTHSANLSTDDGTLTNVTFPLTPGTFNIQHATAGTKKATVDIVGFGGTGTCSLTYQIVNPPTCTLAVTRPSPATITQGQSVDLAITWTNNSDPTATPVSAALTSILFPPSPPTQQSMATAFITPTATAPSSVISVVPPNSPSNQVFYRASIAGAATTTTCDSGVITIIVQ